MDYVISFNIGTLS